MTNNHTCISLLPWEKNILVMLLLKSMQAFIPHSPPVFAVSWHALMKNLTSKPVCSCKGVDWPPLLGASVWFELFGWRQAWMLGCTSSCCRMLLRVGAESRATACSFFSSRPLFASGTQLPHLTFSIWPLPRGEIARVSKGGCHTSWILLSLNLHSPFSPWWCTWIRNEDIAQLRGFRRLFPTYCSYFYSWQGFDVSWIWVLGSWHLCCTVTSS